MCDQLITRNFSQVTQAAADDGSQWPAFLFESGLLIIMLLILTFSFVAINYVHLLRMISFELFCIGFPAEVVKMQLARAPFILIVFCSDARIPFFNIRILSVSVKNYPYPYPIRIRGSTMVQYDTVSHPHCSSQVFPFELDWHVVL